MYETSDYFIVSDIMKNLLQRYEDYKAKGELFKKESENIANDCEAMLEKLQKLQEVNLEDSQAELLQRIKILQDKHSKLLDERLICLGKRTVCCELLENLNDYANLYFAPPTSLS